MINPLLRSNSLPAFCEIKPEHVEPALDMILKENREKVAELVCQKTPHTWENLMTPLEDLDDRLGQMWSVVGHLNAVMANDDLREVYDKCLAKISNYATEMGQNVNLFTAIKSLVESPEYRNLDYAQKKILENELRDFELAGVNLSSEAKKTYGQLQEQLTLLTAKFEHNLMDATQNWTKLITNEADLAGLPELTVQLAKEAAQAKGLEGYLFTLEQPSYVAVVTYADSRDFRHEVYNAYVTRSSDQGPNAGKWDNTPVMHDILIARKKLAQVLSYANYAELSLVQKMAKDPEEVLHFLNSLALASMKSAREEFEQLQNFAKEKYGVAELEAWDIAYFSEKLREHRYDISQEALRPYFPENQVVSGLFAIVKKLFGITIEETKNVEVWHPDVKFFTIYDAQGAIRGQFYLDLYARPNKRGGAWMDECRVRRKTNSHLQIPIAYLTCNFNRPTGDKPALFNHEEVQTLFHEFGHGLHHLLTKIDYPGVSGINGVPWDVVELPSQFLENWCWEKEAFKYISKHYETGETLPDDLFEKMLNAKNFQSAMQMVRQLEFAIFDFHLHLYFNEEDDHAQIQRLLDKTRDEICVIPVPEFNRFQHGFSHIFAGGYAAGYYSYKWAEVLSSDAFSRFEEEGIFNRETGQLFLNTILEHGGAKDPMELFVAFRGRPPSIAALLRHSGIQ
jgi:oligopeptidase A